MILSFGAIDAVASFPLHHTEAAWTVGDPSHVRKRDLAEHVMASTVDYDVGAMPLRLSMMFFELMPCHALHHLFPTLDCSRFQQVLPVSLATLTAFKVKQKLVPQPLIYFGMWPAWLRGTWLGRRHLLQ